MIEMLIVGGLVSVGRRVGDRWLDDFAASVDGSLRDLLGKLAAALRADNAANATEPSQATKQVVEELERRVESDHTVALQLAKPPIPAGTPAVTLIRQFGEFLRYEMTVIGVLERPVALPGFFNCTTCVAVVDVRSFVGTGVDDFIGPSNRRGTATTEADYEIYFAGPNGPRIWLIRTIDSARRDALIRQLNESFSRSPTPTRADIELNTFSRAGAEVANDPLKAGEKAQGLRVIMRDHIEVVDDYGAQEEDWYRINAPDGIKLFRDALAELVEKQAQQLDDWGTELNQ